MRYVFRTYVPGAFICLALVAWLAFRLDFREFLDELSVTSAWAVLGTLAVVYLSLPLRAMQWELLLERTDSRDIWSSLKAICVGHLGNFLLPARGGELVRAYHLAQLSDTPLSRILPSVVLSRLQDLLPIFALLLTSLAFAAPLDLSAASGGTPLAEPSATDPIPLTVLVGRLTWFVAASGILLGIAYVLRVQTLDLSTRLARRFLPRLAARIEGVSAELVEGLTIVGNWKFFWGAQGLSFLCWALFAVSPIPLLLAFGFNPAQAVLIGIVQTAVTSLTFVLPSTPGAIGTFHALCLASIYACVPNVDPNVALAYTVVIHLIGTLGPGLPGIVILPFEFRHLRKALGRARQATVVPEAVSSRDAG